MLVRYPAPMCVPTASDINVYDSLDERRACEHFLGKDLEQAEALFRENALYYQEDLMWMGPVAFRYYVPAFIRYLRSDHSRDDWDAINCFEGVIRFWIDHYRAEVVPIFELLAAAFHYVLNHYQKFATSPEYDPGLRERLQLILSELRPSAAG
jgi:hypothetical protein